MKYSIIIPHKDIPALLERLIESIPYRNDMEIIIVDDCSSSINRERIFDICSTRDNIILINNDFSLGGGGARNRGLEHAKGEWIIFADSDDFFETSFWGSIDQYADDRYDIIYFLSKGVDSKSLAPIDRGNQYNSYVRAFNKGIKGAEDVLRIYHFVPWAKMFRGGYLRNSGIRFEEVIASNDIMFNTIAGTQAQNIMSYLITMYNVTLRDGSLTRNETLESLKCRFLVDLRRSQYLIKKGKSQYAGIPLNLIKKIVNLYGVSVWTWILQQIVKSKTNILYIIYAKCIHWDTRRSKYINY